MLNSTIVKICALTFVQTVQTKLIFESPSLFWNLFLAQHLASTLVVYFAIYMLSKSYSGDVVCLVE